MDPRPPVNTSAMIPPDGPPLTWRTYLLIALYAGGVLAAAAFAVVAHLAKPGGPPHPPAGCACRCGK